MHAMAEKISHYPIVLIDVHCVSAVPLPRKQKSHSVHGLRLKAGTRQRSC